MAIQHISVALARENQLAGQLLVDIREPDEWINGIAAGAITVSKSSLERSACHSIADFNQPVLLICASGVRSAACAEKLLALGYANIQSVEGGTTAWQAAGLPMHSYTASDFDLRYARQMVLPNIGRAGQEKLARSRVLLVGAGGLGSPAALYLAAAGVGHLRIVDDDVVDLSNLQRQILHKNSNIGELKVNSAKATLNALNPSISVEIQVDKITTANINNYLNNVHLVIDGTDNFSVRYAINDACTAIGVPWVYGAVYRYEGQVSLFHTNKVKSHFGCYRCLFPETGNLAGAPNCTEAGVLGVAPGIIGVLQATEALKYLLGIGESLAGRLLHIDLLSMRMHETKMTADPECAVCGSDAV